MVIDKVGQADISSLWDQGHSEPDWPLTDRSLAGFEKLVEAYEVASAFDEGGLYAVREGAALCGYATVHRIPDTYLPAGLHAVECGTYLLPEHRGRGLNKVVKRGLLSLSFDHFLADWCVFVIPTTNTRALRALDKLLWSFYTQRVGNAGMFDLYLKRKSWEIGQPVSIYALPRGSELK